MLRIACVRDFRTLTTRCWWIRWSSPRCLADTSGRSGAPRPQPAQHRPGSGKSFTVQESCFSLNRLSEGGTETVSFFFFLKPTLLFTHPDVEGAHSVLPPCVRGEVLELLQSHLSRALPPEPCPWRDRAVACDCEVGAVLVEGVQVCAQLHLVTEQKLLQMLVAASFLLNLQLNSWSVRYQNLCSQTHNCQHEVHDIGHIFVDENTNASSLHIMPIERILLLQSVFGVEPKRDL